MRASLHVVRVCLLFGCALLAAPPASAQSKSFDTAENLYAIYELGQGGRPLYAQLFRHGWPTTRSWSG